MMHVLFSTFLVVFVTLLFANPVLCQSDEDARAAALREIDPRLLGEEAPVGRFPYICSLRRRGTRVHACGATLVNPLWAVTAAHCVDPDAPDSVGRLPVVYCGIHDINDQNPDLIFNAVRTVMHFSWSGAINEGYDIAMIQLDRSAHLIVPVLNVPDNLPEPNELLAALGWGETPENPSPEKLQLTTRLNFITYRTCNSLWSGVVPANVVLCAGIGERDTCRGDSGGPLLTLDAPGGVVNDGAARLDLLVGVTSFGANSCGGGTRPGVYTNVGFFSEWIQGVIVGTVEVTTTTTTAPASPAPRSPSPVPTSSPSSSRRSRRQQLEDVIEAIEEDDAATVMAILGEGLDASSRYNDSDIFEGDSNDSLLHWAARYDSPESARALLEFGASLVARNTFNNAPMHYCSIHNAIKVVEVLFDDGASLEIKGNNGAGPLGTAARTGSTEVAQFLVTNGAMVNVVDDFGLTPLHRAAYNGHLEIARILINAGATVEIKDDGGETPLQDATWNGYLEIARLLLANGADPNAVDEDGTGILHFAAFRGHADITELLLLNGADISLKEPDGETALHIASREGNVGVARVLISNGADLNVGDENGFTPLHYAANSGEVAVLRLLLENGAEIDKVDNFGETPLQDAVWQGELAAARVLLANGADPNAVDDDGIALIHFAAFRGHADLAELLLNNGADIAATEEEDGETALHLAAREGHLDVVRVLINAGASKNVRDDNGNRPEDVVCNDADPDCTSATREAIQDLVDR